MAIRAGAGAASAKHFAGAKPDKAARAAVKPTEYLRTMIAVVITPRLLARSLS